MDEGRERGKEGRKKEGGGGEEDRKGKTGHPYFQIIKAHASRASAVAKPLSFR